MPSLPGMKIIRGKDVQLWLDGYAFLAAAQVKAQTQLDQIDEVHETSRKHGFEVGRQLGEQQAATLLATTSAHVNAYVASLEQQIVDLSLSIVEKIMGNFEDAELVSKLAQHALQTLQRAHDVTITVAPDLAREVARRIQTEDYNPSVNVTVLPDPRLSGTKCVLSNAIAVVDAGLDTQLSAIREALMASSGNTVPGK